MSFLKKCSSLLFFYFFIYPVRSRVDSFDRRVTCEKRTLLSFPVCCNKIKSGKFIEILWAFLIKHYSLALVG